MTSRKLATALVSLTGLALMAWGPASASADSYAPGTNNQNFATGQGGWTQTSTASGLCLPVVLCPAVNNSFIATGGAAGAGDGYIDTSFTSLVNTLAGTVTGVWQSPSFAYSGNGGVNPATATLNLKIQPQLNSLLGLNLLSTANYRVDLVDQTNSNVVQVVGPTALTNSAAWASIPSAAVNPSLLTLGHSYKIRITTTYTSVVTVVVTGDVGYDDVSLTTAGTGSGGGGGGDNIYNGGSGITNTNQLTQLILNGGLPNSATLVGNKLRLKVKCPKQAAPLPCKETIQGLSKGKKSKPATSRKKTKIKAGKFKKVVVKVKPKFLAKYQKAKKVTIKAKVTVGKVKATVTKKVKVIH